MSIPELPVCAVIITYHPDYDYLATLLTVLAEQADNIVIVDNATPGAEGVLSDFKAAIKNLDVVFLDDNYGIGHAQNVGIEFAGKKKSKYVALFDQDSCPEQGMIDKLLRTAAQLEGQGVRLGAVAPCYKDAQAGVLSSFVRVGLFGFSRTPHIQGQGPIEADFLISSGSVIPLSVLDDIGGVDASLFIDHVDTEWCFRAISQGYKLFGVADAVMLHSLGDRRVRFWFLRWRTVPYHSPFRYYYMFRNSVLLQRRAYMPFKWKLADITRCLRAFVFFGLFSASRTACVKMMIRGVRDGLSGVTGKLKS